MIFEIKNKNDENIKKYFQRLIGNGLLVEAEKVKVKTDYSVLMPDIAIVNEIFVLSVIEHGEYDVMQKKILSIRALLAPNKISAYFYGLTISEINMTNEIQYSFLFDASCRKVKKVSLWSLNGSGVYNHYNGKPISEVVHDVDALLLFEFEDKSQLLLFSQDFENEPRVCLLYEKGASTAIFKGFTDKLHEVFTVSASP